MAQAAFHDRLRSRLVAVLGSPSLLGLEALASGVDDCLPQIILHDVAELAVLVLASLVLAAVLVVLDIVLGAPPAAVVPPQAVVRDGLVVDDSSGSRQEGSK